MLFKDEEDIHGIGDVGSDLGGFGSDFGGFSSDFGGFGSDAATLTDLSSQNESNIENLPTLDTRKSVKIKFTDLSNALYMSQAQLLSPLSSSMDEESTNEEVAKKDVNSFVIFHLFYSFTEILL